MDPEFNSFQNVEPSTTISSPINDGKKDGMLLPGEEAPVESSTSVLSSASVTLGGTIPKELQRVHNDSFVSLQKPDILSTTPQNQLLANASVVKDAAVKVIEDAEKVAQVTVASQVLSTIQEFLNAQARLYAQYYAPGATHEEQTTQNVPTIQSEVNEEELQNSFSIVQHIAIKALTPT